MQSLLTRTALKHSKRSTLISNTILNNGISFFPCFFWSSGMLSILTVMIFLFFCHLRNDWLYSLIDRRDLILLEFTLHLWKERPNGVIVILLCFYVFLVLFSVQELRDAIDAAKVTSLNIKISENTDMMSLYKIVDTFLLKKPNLKLLSHDSVVELAERFLQFCTKKISNIRQQLDSQPDHWVPRAEDRLTVSFMTFN